MSLLVSDPMEEGGEWSIPWCGLSNGVVCPIVHPRGDVVHPLVHPLGVICPTICLGDVADPPGRRCGSRGAPGAQAPPLTLFFEAPKLSIFGPYLIFP